MDKFIAHIKDANTIVMTTHLYPDADGIGCLIALSLALKEFGKDVYNVIEEELPDRYKYLDSNGCILSVDEFKKKHSQVTDKIDLLIVLDTNSLIKTGQKVRSFFNDISGDKMLFIDHHPYSEELDDVHLIDPSSPATAMMVTDLIEKMKVPITKQMALPLYIAIMVDTNSFRYPSVTGKTHRTIAKLIDTGAVLPADAYNRLYGARSLNHLQLLGKILSNAQTAYNGKIGWIVLTLEMLQTYGVDHNVTNAFVNHLLILDNIQVACMFREEEKDIVKVSLRSFNELDVGNLAEKLGGGGHEFSSGTNINGEIDSVVNRTINRIIEEIRIYEQSKK